MKNVFLIVIFLGVGFTAFAQPGGGGGAERIVERFENQTPEDRAQSQTDRMTKQLSLTEEQVPQVSAINLKYEKLMQEKYTEVKESQDRFAFMEAMRDLRDQRHEELKPILTAEQLAKLEEVMQKQEGRGRGGKGKKGQRN